MIVRVLTAEQSKDIYQKHLKKDFAPDEVKPFSAIKELLDRNEYLCVGFFEEEGLSAYAYFVTPKGCDAVLLDYFAVIKDKRNNGIGSKCISLMPGVLGDKTMLLETEHPDFAKTQEDQNTRLRRIAFYEKNGIRMSAVHTRLFGVDFKIMSLSKETLSDSAVYKKITQIYNSMFKKFVFTTRLVKIFDLEG